MEKINSSDKKKIIFIWIILVVALLIVYIISSKDGKTMESENIDLSVLSLKSENRFFTIKSSLNEYVECVKYENANKIMQILDKKYIEENGINSNNVFDLLETYKTSYFVDVREIYQIKRYKNIYVYYVKSKLIEEQYDSIITIYKDKLYYRVTINENTLSYAVAPITEEEYMEKVGDYDE